VGALKRKLAAEGVTLSAGLIVNFYGYVDVYAPQGKIGFTITQIDVQGLLGDVARRRAELIARLTAEGLLDSNKQSHFHRSVARRTGRQSWYGGLQRLHRSVAQLRYGFEIVLVKSGAG